MKKRENLRYKCRGNEFQNHKCFQIVVTNPIKLSEFRNSCCYEKYNSYLFFQEKDMYIKNHNLKVVSGGEVYGTIGFLEGDADKEIRKIVQSCKNYRVLLDDYKEQHLLKVTLHWN